MIQRRPAGVVAALCVALAASLSAAQTTSLDVGAILRRAGDKVTEYFARAQSIMCLEKVSLQKLGIGYGADGAARQVESELRLSWEPSEDDPTPTIARTLRQVLRVNGSTPRKKDYDNCTTPEQQDSEEQPLSLLLPSQREKYDFTYSGRDVIDRRDAIVIAYREIRKPTVDVSLIKDNEDCISFDIEGGMRGRIWIDADTHDVLRLDRSLGGLIEIPLPRKVTRRRRLPTGRWSDGIRRSASSASRSRIRRRRWSCRSSPRRCRSPAAPARPGSAPPRDTSPTAGSSPPAA